MANKCKPELWVLAKRVSAALTKEGVNHALVGTAALAVLGHEVPHEDVDFLVETPPDVRSFVWAGLDVAPPSYQDATSVEVCLASGSQILSANLIHADSARIPFMPPDPDLLDGVPVASLVQVLNLKMFAGRKKDWDFFDEHPQFDIRPAAGPGAAFLDD